MIREVGIEEAKRAFNLLPPALRIATLSPEYVAADAKRDKSLIPTYLVWEDGAHVWMHFFHRSLVPNTDFWDISSAYGYGGPLSNTDYIYPAWGEYLYWCKKNHILAEFVRFHPLLNQRYYGTKTINRLTCTMGGEYTPNCRYMVRKAQRSGLRVQEHITQEIYMRFAEFYREGMKRIGADKMYHFNDEYFLALSKLDAAHLLVCENEMGDWRSAAVFLQGEETIEYHLAATSEAGKRTGASNMVIHCGSNGYNPDAFFLGGGKTVDEEDSLFKYKASFGGKQLPFFIGQMIHNHHVYTEMKKEATKTGTLFWR